MTHAITRRSAIEPGRKLRWGPTRERFDGDDAAHAMLDFERRAPWML